MQENDHIRELFSESFKNFEEPVRPELWNNIVAKIGATPAPSAGNTATGVKGAAAAAKISVSAAAWIAGAAIVVSGIAGYFYFTQKNQSSPATEIQNSDTNAQQNNLNTDNQDNKTNNTAPLTGSGQNAVVNSGVPVTNTKDEKSTVSNTAENSSHSISNSGNSSTTPLASGHSKQQTQSEPAAATSGNNAENNLVSGENTTDNAGNSEAQKPSATAYPTIGYAPLSVDFTLSGDVEKTEWDFGDGTSGNKSGSSQHIFEKPGIYAITVKSTDHKGNLNSEIIKIEVLADLNIKNIPNVFTPNQDGSNDLFSFKADHLTDIEVTIYDKSGKMVTRYSNPEEGWNGRLAYGEDAPEGTYFYVIFATGNGSKKHQQGGTITLIR